MTSVIPDTKHHLHYWWIFMLSGACLTAFGLYVATNPSLTYDGLSLFFAGILIVSGIFELAFCISNRNWFTGWVWFLAGAILDLVLGAVFITNPILAAISLPFFAGCWLLVRSAVLVGRAFQAKKKRLSDWPWLLGWAVTGILFSVINIYNPLFSEDRSMIWTAFALLGVGIFYIHFSVLVKQSHKWIGKHIHT